MVFITLRCWAACLLCAVALSGGLRAQDSLQRSTDLYRFGDGIAHTLAGPGRWKGKDWLKVGGVLALTAAATLVDEPLRDFWRGESSVFMDGVERVGFYYGKPYSAAAITGGVYLSGVLFHRDHLRETGLIMGTVLATGGLLQTVLKTGIGRARPRTNNGHLYFDPLNPSGEYHSFPSGHAWMATAIGFVVISRTKSIPLKILFSTLAGGTLVARMYADAHWVSDLVFSTALAYVCTRTVGARIGKNQFRQHKRASAHSLRASVMPGPRGMRITLQW